MFVLFWIHSVCGIARWFVKYASLVCVAVCCSVLRVLQWVAWHISVWCSWHASVLQRVANVAVCCSALQCVAVCRLVHGLCLSISLWFCRQVFFICVATHVTPTCLLRTCCLLHMTCLLYVCCAATICVVLQQYVLCCNKQHTLRLSHATRRLILMAGLTNS